MSGERPPPHLGTLQGAAAQEMTRPHETSQKSLFSNKILIKRQRKKGKGGVKGV